MLEIVIPEQEVYDEEKEEFICTKSCTLQLEHSLVSLSKWESKWEKPFLSKDERTDEEVVDYIRFMTITQNVKPEVYNSLTPVIFKKVEDYIKAPMTATWFNEREQQKHSKEVITAEIIYYWMIANNIPFECQKWHLNRLLTLIRVCGLKSAPQKKMSRKEMLANRHRLNAQRRAKAGSKG